MQWSPSRISKDGMLAVIITNIFYCYYLNIENWRLWVSRLVHSVSDPYHLVGSGSVSVSGSVDMDPGSAKGLLRQKVYIF